MGRPISHANQVTPTLPPPEAERDKASTRSRYTEAVSPKAKPIRSEVLAGDVVGLARTSRSRSAMEVKK